MSSGDARSVSNRAGCRAGPGRSRAAVNLANEAARPLTSGDSAAGSADGRRAASGQQLGPGASGQPVGELGRHWEALRAGGGGLTGDQSAGVSVPTGDQARASLTGACSGDVRRLTGGLLGNKRG